MSKSNASLIVLAELLFFGLVHFFSTEIIVALNLENALPEMPLVKRAWVGFAIVVIIITWLTLRRADLRDYGLKGPSPVWRTALFAIIGVVTAITVSTVTDPFIEEWFGKTDTTVFSGVKGNLGMFLYLLPLIWVFAAFGEEFFYRGFLMTSVAHVLGGARIGWFIALIFQAVIFGLGHEYQGLGGMIGTGLYALVFGGLYLAAGRNLWAPALAHGLLDTLGFTLLYLGVIEA